MKRVLVTGASGTIGYNLMKQLVALGEYEVSAFDLKSNKSLKRLKEFRDNVNIVYGDITEEKLIKELVLSTDVIIHLSGVIPPLANIKSSICEEVDYEGTKTLVNNIKKYNPKCYLIYASSTTVYGSRTTEEEIKVTDEVKLEEDDNYSKIKLLCEEYIKDNLNIYTILRLPAILGDIKRDAPMYNIPLKERVEFIMASDAARAFLNTIVLKKELNKKILNIAGGDPCRTAFKSFLVTILKVYGVSIRFIGTWFLVEKNFHSHFYADSDTSDKIINYRKSTLDNYYVKISNRTGRVFRFIPKLLALPFIIYLKRK